MGADDDESTGESDASSPRSGGGGGRNRTARGKVATLQMCPLDLRFSQKKMRSVFMDGRSVEATSELVTAVRRDAEEADLYGAPWRLEAPFPPIELLRWRCKLRNEHTGRPLTDPETGEELMEEESWFTLDNRRLCCLQMAAVQLLPERCTVAVVAEMPKGARRMREIRKFRTLDSGKSIMVGSVVDGVPFERWDWRAKVAELAKNSTQSAASGSGGKAASNGPKAGKRTATGGGKSGEGGRGNSKGGCNKAGTAAAASAPCSGDSAQRGKGGKHRGGRGKGAEAYKVEPDREEDWEEDWGEDWSWQHTGYSGQWASGAQGACSGWHGGGGGGKGRGGGKCKGGGSGGDGGHGGRGGYGKRGGRGCGKATNPERPADAEETHGQAAPSAGRRRRHGRMGDGTSSAA